MARLHTGLPANASVCRLAVLIAAALGGISASAWAADNTKEDTITVTAGAASVQQESAWGPAPTIAAKRTATATKTDTPIEKTPQSISVVTREEMDMRQPQTVKEALSYTPGVFATRGSSNTYDVVSIRGFTSPSTVNTNQYLDGLRLQGNNYSEVSMDPYFLERAELIRGPVSVLYGNSNPGGVISMVSKRPTTEPLREIQFKAGSRSLFQTGFDFSDALDDNGVYSYRLTGLAFSQNAQQESVKANRYAIAPSFSWRPDDKTDFTFLSNFQSDPNAGYYGWLPRTGTVVPYVDANGQSHKLPTDFNEGDPDNKMQRRQQMVGYSFAHAFDDTFTVRQNLRYAHVNTMYRSVYGFGMTEQPGILKRSYVRSDEDLTNFGVDTQLESKFDTGPVAHQLLTGVDYLRSRNDVDAQYGDADPLNLNNGGVTPSAIYPYGDKYQVVNRLEQTGLYVQDQAEWNQWVLTLGGRYDFAKSSVHTRKTSYADTSDNVNRDEAFTWRGGINYLFDNGISPYFSYSESFEPNAGRSLEGTAFDPSRGKQYEAGVKFVPNDRPIVVTASVFQITKDKNLTADPRDVNFSIMGGEIRSRGVELEAKAALNANIDMTAAYSYTDAEYTEDTKYQNKRPAEIPRNMASLWMDYTFHETALSGLTMGAGVRYVGNTSSFYGNTGQTFTVPSYTVADATVKYDLARVGLPGSSVGVNVTNLFNRDYVSSCYRDYACYWGAERQVIATATFRF